MHRKLAIAFTAALILAVAPGAFAWQVTCNSYKSVAGADYARTAPYMSFKFCNTSSGACYWGNTGGFASGVFDAPEGTYNGFIWDPYYYQWGSTDLAVGQFTIFATPYGQVISLSAYPRPFAPTLVEPCNYCGVPNANFNLKWTDGLDADRRAANWPVTYDIWASETPNGWPTQPEHLTIADAPCNPDTNGKCTWWVDQLTPESGRQYTWRIVVKINFGQSIYTTSGPSWHLHQY